MLALKRRLYQLILRLHPAAFRNRFAREMSLDFDDALAAYGFSRLLADATRSLLRQWASPVFSPSREQAPIPSHPLLAGHYMPLTDAPLTPIELLRGSLLFAVVLFALSLALKHGGNYIHTGGHNVGLAGGTGNPFQRASTSQAAAHSSAPDYSQTLVIPTPNLPSRYSRSARSGHTIYVNPAAPAIYPQTASWKGFLLRCAVITAVVWLTSFLLRRAKAVGARVAYLAAGFSCVALAALMPFSFADTSPHADSLHPDDSRLHFESAVIRLHRSGLATDSATVSSAPTGTAANLVHIDSSIRTLLANMSNLPPDSIVGGPSWLDTDSYDIIAKIDPATLAAIQKLPPYLQRSQARWMEQRLLVDRFHLTLHVETRQPDVFSPTTQPLQVLVIDHIEKPSEN